MANESHAPPASKIHAKRYTVECPACSHAWPATEADLGLRHCSVCGAALEVTRMPVVWIYEAVEVTAVKADDDT